MDIRSFITSYLDATESKTPRTRSALCFSSTVWNPKWVSLMGAFSASARLRRVAARGGGGRRRGHITARPGVLQSTLVLAPKIVLLRSQEIQVFPGKNPRVVAIAEPGLHGIVAHRFERGHADLALAGLQDFLAATVALDLRRGRVHPHQLERNPKRLAIGKFDFQHA